MGQPRPQMIAGAVQKNLRLVFKPAKRTRVNDSSAVALKLGPVGMALLGIFSAARVPRFLREWRKGSALGRLHFLACFPTVLHLAINPLMSILLCRAGSPSRTVSLAKTGRFQFFAQLTLRSSRLQSQDQQIEEREQ